VVSSLFRKRASGDISLLLTAFNRRLTPPRSPIQERILQLILENIMSLIKTTSTLSRFVFLAVLAAGCGQSSNNIEPQERDLSEIFEVYQTYMKAHKQQPPEKLSDFKNFKRINAAALRSLEEGKYVIVWGVKDRDAGTVLAYEKDAPTNGGWAVMADGKVKRLDAQAFENVPKPQK
jgi:hypothetical protein